MKKSKNIHDATRREQAIVRHKVILESKARGLLR